MSKAYTRVCCECGDTKEVSYKPKEDTKCRACASIGNTAPTKPKHLLIRHTYTCPDCGETRSMKAKCKSPVCGACNHKRIGKANKGKTRNNIRYYRICPYCPEEVNTIQVASAINGGVKPCIAHKFEGREKVTYITKPKKEKPEYFRICPHCPEDANTIQVASSFNSGVKPCKAHKYVGTEKHKRKLSKKKVYQSVGTDGAKRNKVNIKKPTETTKKLTDEEMMATFLATNSITVIEPFTSEQFVLREKF